ncbi:glycoside hydrolase family 18 protein, partial [Sodiomyces alcalophilus JCM 7366]|uniref:glycoside hydrolase family 18 protein n=1 Tax=Sodiomyces alcalophilus JCM 7366 TaxID=591952 RepID=UPI0039B6B775
MRAQSRVLGRCVLLFLSFSFFISIGYAQEPECSANIPCESGCCSRFGFCGYGKDYCHEDVCLNNCDRLAECDPGGFGSNFVEKTKCPLNVCCSKHGFCGTTDEYCGDKKVSPPSCSDHSLQRVVGYYEGWAARRPCNAFMPEQIPAGVYTHLNFAFATIDPGTFEVRPASSADIKLYKRLASLKRIDPDLKILIAIGGWTFNDPGPTATTFSDIARSESAQKAFIRSLISMMSTYDFDGVDLDWEYPVAKDRSGRDEDFENFPKFLANLKKALKATGGRDEVTLTLPASFWYLQHFDIVQLEKHVDFFNIMSYDLHGTWDKTNKWVGPYLNAHTNLTEIKEAMNLLWRNNIDPDKVVLGTGFYGRAFTATSPNCLSPGCTYESGAPRQPCSNEIGVMIQSEIVDVMERTGRTPTLNEEAAVQILTFDSNQWVAYDDEDTLQMKADFAREQCLSGVMVWAVSQDVSDGKYSRAIGKAAGRKFTSLPGGVFIEDPEDDDGLIRTVTKHPQCKWTNCGQTCPPGWIRMMRKDREARTNEYMVDDSYCSEGVHELCCPPEGNTPTCGWYQHNNGKCDPTCPEGTLEVGSLKKHCNNQKYQAACCTTSGKSMDLYDQCDWAEAPMCMWGQCSSGHDEVARSPTGSGGAVCNVEQWSWEDGTIKIQERKYCCDQEDDKKWDDCKWYNNLGPGTDDEDYCRSGCPSDRVRVAMDGRWNKDGSFHCRRGARAKCCIPKHSTITKRESSLDAVYRNALESFLDDPVCSEDGGGFTFNSMRMSITTHARALNTSEPRKLQTRQSWGSFQQDEVKSLVYKLLLGTATMNQRAIWNDIVPNRYSNLEWDDLQDWIDEEEAVYRYGYDQLAYLIACHMGDFNNWVGGTTENNCECDTDACCPGGGDHCASEDSIPDDDQEGAGFDGDDDDFFSVNRFVSSIQCPLRFITSMDSWTHIIEQYYPATHSFWNANHPIWSNVYLYPQDDCIEVYPRVVNRRPGQGGVHAEHIIELHTIAQFFTHALAGNLPSGRRMTSGPISDSLVRRTLQGRYTIMPPQMPGGGISDEPLRRIFNALGSEQNTQYMVLAQGGLNMVKSALWRQDTSGRGWTYWLGDNHMNTAMGDIDHYERFIALLRDPIVAINYLADPTVWGNLVAVVDDIRVELERLQDFHQGLTGISDDLVGAWDEFIRDLLQETVRTAQDHVRRWVTNARNEYQG